MLIQTHTATVGHHLTPEYVARVGRFAATFPAACSFLRRIESEGPEHGLWLSTSVNAHVYKGPGFVAYLKIKNPELKPPSLVISPKFNLRIAAHTTDESARLFPTPFQKVVTGQGGVRAGWAVQHAGGATELTALTPTMFFDSLFDLLSSLEMSGDARATRA